MYLLFIAVYTHLYILYIYMGQTTYEYFVIVPNHATLYITLVYTAYVVI